VKDYSLGTEAAEERRKKREDSVHEGYGKRGGSGPPTGVLRRKRQEKKGRSGGRSKEASEHDLGSTPDE